jgi:hypothetical protein
MNPRIASIENTIARDPGGRNIFGIALTDQLRLAAQSLRFARRVGIVSGFHIPEANAGETDGPPGAKVVGQALAALGIEVDYITDPLNAALFTAISLTPLVDVERYLDDAKPTHLVSIERVGRAADGRYRNMHGMDIGAGTAPLDELFLRGSAMGLTTIGIGDGGNEIGMGKVFASALAAIDHGDKIACIVPTDFVITAGVSNWGAYGLAGALSVLEGRDLLPSAEDAGRDIEIMVERGQAVDGVTHRSTATVDGLPLSESLRMLESVRRQITVSPLAPEVTQVRKPRRIGILGYGKTGRGVAALLASRGHEVSISEAGPPGSLVLDGPADAVQHWRIETEGHTIGFLRDCDLVVSSPGVPADAPIRDDLHRLGVPVISGLELAYQLCDRELIAITGTVGKRTTCELLQTIFESCGRPLTIGGNKGRPLSELLLDEEYENKYEAGASREPIALAVSSFQLETVVHFRPHIAVFLNLDEAHLDRHLSLAEYTRIKSRIFMNQHPDDVLILNFDDERIRSLARKHQGRTFFMSTRQEVDRGAWLADGIVYANIDGPVEQIGPASPPFPENLLACVVTARLSGLSADAITDAILSLAK